MKRESDHNKDVGGGGGVRSDQLSQINQSHSDDKK